MQVKCFKELFDLGLCHELNCFLHAKVVDVTPGSIGSILSCSAERQTELEIWDVWLHTYGRAQHATLRLVVFPVDKNIKRKKGKIPVL